MIKGLIFDLDGVIVDTAKNHYYAWKKIAESIGINFGKKENELIKGLSRKESLEKIISLSKSISIKKSHFNNLLIQKNEEYLNSISNINKNDRIICSSSISSMGTGLAETIGCAKSKKFSKYICIIGDGSFLMNVQDLQTIYQDKINVLIILVNNTINLLVLSSNKFLKAPIP